MVGDDIEARRRRRAALRACAPCSSAPGSSGPTSSNASRIVPDGIVSLDRAAPGVAGGASGCVTGRRRPDRDRARAPGARPARGLPGALLHRGRARLLRLAPEPGPALRGRFAGKEAVGKALGSRRPLRLARDRDRAAGRSPRSGCPAGCSSGPSGSAPGEIELSMTHSKELAAAVCAWSPPMSFEPLYTAAEMRAAEERYPGLPGHGPRADGAGRAGRRRPRRSRTSPDARRITVVCGGGTNGGDGRVAAELLAQAGREVPSWTRRRRRARRARRDRRRALRHRLPRRAAPRGRAADRADQRRRRAGRRGRPALRRRRLDRRGRRARRSTRPARSPSTARRSGLAVAPGRFHAGAGRRRRHRAGAGRDACTRSSTRDDPRRSCRAARRATTSTPQAPCSSSAARAG